MIPQSILLPSKFLATVTVAAALAGLPGMGKSDDVASSAAKAAPASNIKIVKTPKIEKTAVEVDPLMIAPSAPDGSLTLRSTIGQEIQAHLLSVHGDSVKIVRSDNHREFIVPIASFDESTGDQIRHWMDQAPEAISYSLSISSEKNLIDSSSFETAGRQLKTTKWSYRVKVANMTRNDLVGAKIEYRIVYNDHVEFTRSVVNPGKGANQQDGQAVDLPQMAFNDEIEFDTPPILLNTYEYAPSRGDREYMKDSIKGIWVKITKNDQVIGEYKSNPSSLTSVNWDNNEDLEIRFTNRFRDSVGSQSSE
ncbi:MAG: hypothetical protein KA250_01405 [Verrucomicrobiales bacterium]|nr:hypothetical protein [Verrucomicrobiales bacterium]MBP9224036.1 hypothetical protein [Verrucomicrobiales bacterium]